MRTSPVTGSRERPTTRRKLNQLDLYYAFLEQRYAGEIRRRFGVGVESPIDAFNRPRHRGDFGLRVPPSRRAMTEFFRLWRQSLPGARKPAVACRDYTMAKLAYICGTRAAELCTVKLGDVHWEAGHWGRFWSRARARTARDRGCGRPSCSLRGASCSGGESKRFAACSVMTPWT